MRLLHRYPGETARKTRDEKLRRQVPEEAPFLAAIGTRDEKLRRQVPEEAPPHVALRTRDEELRREVLGGPPRLERWDLVESRWSLGSVLVLLAGAALAVLGVVAAARTGINDTWYRPVVQVAGLRHTPLLAAVETGVGVLLVIAGLAGARGLAAAVCIAGAIAAGVAAIEPELVAEELALPRWWAITLAAAGAGLAMVSMVPWPHFVERHYARAAGIAPSATPDATPGPLSRRSGHRTRQDGHDVPHRRPRSRPGVGPSDTSRHDRCPTTGTRPSITRSASILHGNEPGGAAEAGSAVGGAAPSRRRRAPRRDRRDTARDTA